jgi:hypothetical protein
MLTRRRFLGTVAALAAGSRVAPGKAFLSAAKMDPVAIYNARATKEPEPVVEYAMNITGLTPEQIAAAEADPDNWVKRG